jgi:hypothetical protein
MTDRKTEGEVEFECTNEVCGEMPTWYVDGRWNAEGEFEPNDLESTACPECGVAGGPEDIEIELAS